MMAAPDYLAQVSSLSHRQRGLIGALICICANTLISFALNVQKLAHLRTRRDGERRRSSDQRRGYGSIIHEEEEEEEEGDSGNGVGRGDSGSSPGPPNTRFLRSGLWWVGMSLMTLGEGGNFISYGFAPASLVAPLGSVALLANVFIAPLLLKERFARSDLLGVFLAAIGAAGVVAASSTDGDGDGGPHGPDALWSAIKEQDFIIYASIMLVFGCTLAYFSATRFGDRFVLIDVGTCAVFGGFTVLSTKGVSSMLSFGSSGRDLVSALKSPLSYGLLFTLVSTAVVQLTFLNRALQRFDARTVIPSQFVFFTISAISGSAVLFRDFERATAGSIAGFLAGCATTFAGVFVLTRREDESAGKEDGEQGGQVTPPRGKVSSSSAPTLPIDDVRRGRASSREPLLAGGVPTRAAPVHRPAGPIATLTTGSVPTSSTSTTHLASTSLPNATLRMTPSRPIMRTPRLSLVGGTAMGAGGYLLLATPGTRGRSVDIEIQQERGVSVSPRPRLAVPSQRDISSGQTSTEGDSSIDVDRLSSSVARALKDHNRRPRNKSAHSDLSLSRSYSSTGGSASGARPNRYSREFE